MTKKAGYIGQAGTGKTTKLIKDLESYAREFQWSDNNRILALTFMHGSRKRLENKLKYLYKEGFKYDCQTIDSFSSLIFHRFRRLLGINKLITIHAEPSETPFYLDREGDCLVNFAFIRKKVCEILKLNNAKKCIQNTYPIIVVDEFQDCDADLLEIVKHLADVNSMFLAADDFQSLNTTEEECDATKWLKDNFETVELGNIWRTSNSSILKSASALRENTSTNQNIKLEVCPSPQLAAFIISAQMNWQNWGQNDTSVAIISPVNASKSKYIRDIFARLGSSEPWKNKPGRKNYTLYPCKIVDEADSSEKIDDILALITDFSNVQEITEKEIADWKSVNHPVIKSTLNAVKKLFQTRGQFSISKESFLEQLNKQLHYFKIYRQKGLLNGKPIYTTVHGAKNREFDYVIVLWPYESPLNGVYKRKLLYNAITRAKRDAILVIQAKNASTVKKDEVFSLFKNFDK